MKCLVTSSSGSTLCKGIYFDLEMKGIVKLSGCPVQFSNRPRQSISRQNPVFFSVSGMPIESQSSLCLATKLHSKADVVHSKFITTRGLTKDLYCINQREMVLEYGSLRQTNSFAALVCQSSCQVERQVFASVCLSLTSSCSRFAHVYGCKFGWMGGSCERQHGRR